MARRELDTIGRLMFTAQGGADTTGLLGGIGTNANPALTAKADKNFFDFRFKSSCATGTARGIYAKLYLTGGSGGEAGRFFTHVAAAAPVDTCNGMHNSLEFGTSVGNVTGLATATRNTFHLPGRAINGTCAPIMSEVYSDSASSDLGGLFSFIRVCNDGAAGGKAKVNTKAHLMEIAGITTEDGGMFFVGAPVTLAASLRIRVGAALYYIPLYATHK